MLQPTAVNQALCWNQKGRIYVFVLVLEIGLVLYQSAGVRTVTYFIYFAADIICTSVAYTYRPAVTVFEYQIVNIYCYTP